MFKKLNIFVSLVFLLLPTYAYSQWERVPLYGGSCSRLIVNRFSPNQIFALTRYSGLFISYDTGYTWKAMADINRNMHGRHVYDVEVSLTGKIFVASYPTSSPPTGRYWYSYHCSNDNGLSWFEYQNPDSIPILDFEACDDGLLYFLAEKDSKQYVYKSSDDGLSWQNISLPDTLEGYIHSFYVDKQDSKLILLFGNVLKGSNPAIIVRSTDGGISWSLQHLEGDIYYIQTPIKLTDLKDHRLLMNVAYATGIYIYESLDNGLTWSKNLIVLSGRNFDEELPTPITMTSKGYLLNMIDNALYISKDTGRTWSKHSIMKYKMWSFAKATNKLIGSFSLIGMQSTYDDGVNWQPSTYGYSVFDTIELTLVNKDVFFAIVGEQSERNHHQLRQTTDGGKTWQILFDGINLISLRSLNTSPPRYFLIKAPYYIEDSTRSAMVLTGIIGQIKPDTLIKIDSVTETGGTYFRETCDLQISPLDQDIIYFEITHGYRVLYVSSDAGQHWNERPMPKANYGVFRLYPSYLQKEIIFGAGSPAFSTQDWYCGYFISTNFGSNWNWLVWYDPSNYSILLNKDIFFDGIKIRFSSDQGNTWVINKTGLPVIYSQWEGNIPFYGDDKGLFGVTPPNEMYYQFVHDQWLEISKFNEKRLTASPFSVPIALKVMGNNIYTTYRADGMYKLQGCVTAVSDKLRRIPLLTDINIKAFPNPFSTSTIIHFNLPKAEQVQLIIYNIIGIPIVRKSLGELNEGEHDFLFDIKDYQTKRLPGLYYCRIETPSYFHVYKLLKF